MLDPHKGILVTPRGNYILDPHEGILFAYRGDYILDPHEGIIVFPLEKCESLPPFKATTCWILMKESLPLLEVIT